MLISGKELQECSLAARDAELGSVRDVYFDDQLWLVRFLIGRTSRLLGRDVLIASNAIDRVDPTTRQVRVSLSRQDVERGPGVDFAKPVSKQKAEEYFAYYGWPYFWGEPAAWGIGMLRHHGAPPKPPESEPRDERVDPNLRSLREVTGWDVQATDGEIGHLKDVLIDDERCLIPYLVLDTRNWLPGKKVLVLPGSIESFDWHQRKVHVGLERHAIEGAPEWQPDAPLDRQQEWRIHSYYGLTPYWTEAPAETPAPPLP